MARRLDIPRSVIAAPLRAFSEVKLLGVLLLVNLGAALIQSVPLVVPALQQFGRSLSGRGRPFPSIEALADFGRVLAQGGTLLAGSLALGLLLSFAQQIALSGGVVARLCASEPFTLAGFTGQCARLLGRNLRLTGWALLGLLPVIGIAVGTAALLDRAGMPTMFTVRPQRWAIDSPLSGWTLAHLGLVALLLVLWRASFDLARVQLFADDQRRTRVAAWRAVAHLARTPRALLGYLGVALLGLGVVIALAHLQAAVQVTSAARAGLALLAAQLVVVARLGFSVATTAFAVDVYRTLPPLASRAPGNEDAAAPAPEPRGPNALPTDAT